MKRLVLTAFPAEAAAFLDKLQALAPVQPHPAPNVASCRRAALPSGEEVFVACTGLGTEEAAIATCALIAHLTPDAIIMAGTAGAVHPDYEIGDIVLGQEVIQLDLHAIHQLLTDTPFAACLVNPNTQSRLETIWQADARLLEQARQTGLPRVHTGKIFSSNLFPAPSAAFATIGQLGGGAIEMESSGVCRAAQRLGPTPTLTIRAISNVLDEQGRDRGTPVDGIEICSARLAEMLIALVAG